MKKIFKKVIVSVFLMALLFASNYMTSSAAIKVKRDSYSAYSAVGLKVCYVELTAEGDTSNHTISNYYKSAESTAILNSVENQKKWKSNYGKYKKANFSADHKAGIPTPWGTIGYTFSTVYLSATF